MDLHGKVALVTGATGGIGQVVAERLAESGAEVILGVRNVEAGNKVAADIMAKFPGSKVEVGPSVDFCSQNSVKAFAAAMNKRSRPLNILVNNAGLSYIQKAFTEQGVGMLTQVNHLGPYTLTRLLEGKLVASKARVVFVSSIMHRTCKIKDAQSLLTDWRSGYYDHTKLANIYTAFELQRRLGSHGLQSCAVDPGAVRTSIFSNSPMFSTGFFKAVIDSCYSPPEDGATAVVHAATCDWEKDRARGKGGSLLPPQQDLRYYARGTFAWPQICNDCGVGSSLQQAWWNANAAVFSTLDWPLRRLLGTKGWMGQTKLAQPCTHAYDEDIAAAVWRESAKMAELPVEPLV